MHVTEGVRAALEKFWADFCLQAVVPLPDISRMAGLEALES